MSLSFKNDLVLTNDQRYKYFEQLLRLDIINDLNGLDLDSEVIQFNQADINRIFERIRSNETLVESLKILAHMVFINPDQVLTFLKKSDMKFLFSGLDNPESALASMFIIYHAVQNDYHLQNFFDFIMELRDTFFNAIKAILNNPFLGNVKSITILFLQSLSIIDEIRPFLIEFQIFKVINKLANENDEIDFYIAYYYYSVSKFSFGDDTIEFFESIFPLIYCFCEHKNPDIVPYSLETLRLLMQNSLLPYNAIISHSMINIFVGYITLSEYPKIQKHAIRLLNSCIQYQDFPFNAIFDLNIIDIVFEAIQTGDEQLVDLCVSFFKSIFQKCDRENMQKIVERCSKYEFLNLFSFQPFETKVNVINLFSTLIQYSTSENARFFCSEKNIEFILNLMLSANDQFDITSEIAKILNILISRYHSNQKFISYLISLVRDSGCIDYIYHNLDEINVQSNNDAIFGFLRNIDLIEQTLYSAHEV